MSEDLLTRVQAEADLCRNDGADDIARLLDEVAAALAPSTAEAHGKPSAAWRIAQDERLIAGVRLKRHADGSFTAETEDLWMSVDPRDDAENNYAGELVSVLDALWLAAAPESQVQPKGTVAPADLRFSWMDFQQIGEVPAVDEAIRNLLNDQTEDNAVCVVRAICEAAADRLVALAAAQAPAPAPEDERPAFERAWAGACMAGPKETAWTAWQARAALGAPSPAVVDGAKSVPANWSTDRPTSGGLWLWREGRSRYREPVELILTPDGAEVAWHEDAAEGTPQCYWAETSTDQQSMPGLWAKAPQPPVQPMGEQP